MDDLTPRAGTAAATNRRIFLGQGASLALHLAVLVVGALSLPPLGATEETPDLPAATWTMVPVMGTFAELELEENEPRDALRTADPDARDSRVGFAEAGDHDGKAGDATSAGAAGAMSVQGPQDNPDPGLRERAFGERRASALLGPPTPREGDPDGFDVSRDRVGMDPSRVASRPRGAGTAPATGSGGTGAAGLGRGGGARVCIAGPPVQARRGGAKGPVRAAGSASAPAPGATTPRPKVPVGRRLSAPALPGVSPVICDG